MDVFAKGGNPAAGAPPNGRPTSVNVDGTGVAAVYFTDAEAVAAWARDPEHRVAKKRGRV
jgi:hypothetical protein